MTNSVLISGYNWKGFQTPLFLVGLPHKKLSRQINEIYTIGDCRK
jgi:hypothetical protein